MNKAGKVLIIVFSCIGGTIALITGTVILAKHKVFYKKIETAAEFKEALNKGKGKLLIKNDIDLGGETFKPIAFEGVIDGEGHTISNFSIDGNKDNIGLVSAGTVTFTDLNVYNVTVNATSNYKYVGILCGDGGGFKNCSVKGIVNAPLCSYVGGLSGSASSLDNCTGEITVKGNDYVGGLAGECVNIVNSSNNGSVSGNSYVGGLVGFVAMNDKYAKAITNCNSSGKVEALGNYCGGLFGAAKDEHIEGAIETIDRPFISIENCTNNAAVESTADYVGGIIGYNAKKITNSHNAETAKITGHGFVGGITGRSSNIVNCSNKATVTSTISTKEKDEDVAYVGGVAGVCNFIKDSSNEADVTSNGAGSAVGGVAGKVRGQQDSKYLNLTNRGNIVSYGEMTGGVIGLFRSIPDGIPRDTLEINGCRNYGNVTASGSYCGGIIGYSDSAQSKLYSDLYLDLISACENEGIIETAGSHAGGIVGYTFRNKLIKLCKNRGEVSGTMYVGGIAGETKDIAECENYGEIHSYNDQLYTGDSYVGNCGGIAGLCNNINQNTNHGHVHNPNVRVGGIVGSLVILGGNKATQNSNQGLVNGGNYVGGIAGVVMSKVDSSSRVEFSNNTNSALIKGNNYIGGLIGSSNMTKDFFLDFRCTILTVINCSNSGNVEAAMHYSAGIIPIGYYIETDATMWDTNSNTGEIKANKYTGDLYYEISKKGQE